MRHCFRATALYSAALLAAYLYPPASDAQPVLENEVSADGLHRVDPSIIDNAWLRVEWDLSRYTRIFVMPTVVLFRDIPDPPRNARAAEQTAAFPVNEPIQARLREVFGESFHAAMSKMQAFDVSSELGRDVLIVRGLLTDVVTGLPPDFAGSNVSTIRWAWEANVVIEIRDSMSDEVLARTLDRQRVEGPVDADQLWGLAPRITREWSQLLAGHLTALAGLYPSRLWRLQHPSEPSID